MAFVRRAGVFGQLTDHTARAVNWKRLLFRYNKPEARAHITHLQTKINEVQQLYSSLPKRRDEVKWKDWEKKIKTPGVVAAYKSWYEAEMRQPQAQVKAAAAKTEQAREINELEAQRPRIEAKLAELAKEAAINEDFKAKLELATMDDIEDMLPGLHDYLSLRLRNDQWVWDLDVKLESLDVFELRRQLNNGNAKALSVLQFADENEVPFGRPGRLTLREKFTSFGELVAKAEESVVHRAHLLKEIDPDLVRKSAEVAAASRTALAPASTAALTQ